MHDSPTPQNPEPAKRRLEKKSKSKRKPKENKGPSRAEIKEDAGLVVVTELNGAIIPESTIYLKSQKYTGFTRSFILPTKASLKVVTGYLKLTG